MQPGGLQTLEHDVCEALHQGIAQIVVGLTFSAQALAIEDKGARQFEGLRIEVPAVGWKEPRPAEDVSRLNSIT